jgi:hypothetical protein
MPHRALIFYAGMFGFGSLIGFAVSAQKNQPWYFRYAAFSIGAMALALGILIPLRFW